MFYEAWWSNFDLSVDQISFTLSTRFQAIAIKLENKSVLVPMVLLGARSKFRGVIVQVSQECVAQLFLCRITLILPTFSSPL